MKHATIANLFGFFFSFYLNAYSKNDWRNSSNLYSPKAITISKLDFRPIGYIEALNYIWKKKIHRNQRCEISSISDILHLKFTTRACQLYNYLHITGINPSSHPLLHFMTLPARCSQKHPNRKRRRSTQGTIASGPWTSSSAAPPSSGPPTSRWLPGRPLASVRASGNAPAASCPPIRSTVLRPPRCSPCAGTRPSESRSGAEADESCARRLLCRWRRAFRTLRRKFHFAARKRKRRISLRKRLEVRKVKMKNLMISDFSL